MAAALPWIAAGGSVLSMAGSMQAGAAAKQPGIRQKQADIYQADQLDQNAAQSVAAGQHEAELKRMQTALLVSRGIAVAAAGGGGVTDPTAVNLISDIARYGSYKASVDLYQGEERARAMRMAANAKRYEGDLAEIGGAQREEAYNLQALGNAAQGASMFAKYGMGGPKPMSSSPNDAGMFGGVDM